MSYFFVSVLQAFLPVALLLGLNWVVRPAPALNRIVWITILMVVVGMWAGTHYPKSQQLQLVLAGGQILSLILFLFSQLTPSRALGYCWQALLVLGAAFNWGNNPNLGAFTNTHVINTDLLLNLAAIVVAFVWVVFGAVLLLMMVRQLRYIRWPLLILLTLLLILPLSGDAILLLMKLQVLPLTKSLLSYVALVTNGHAWLSYICALLLAITTLCYLMPLRRASEVVAEHSEPIAHRKALADYRNVRRIFIFSLLAWIVVAGAQLYWDKVASQPPQLSEALPVTLAADGLVHIPVEQVRDGKLHRFIWVADDGKAVRFFIINRYPDRLRLSVVFDACLLCGDQGYVMEGNQVICVACAVHIFIPSIGKAGGCNPIPLEDWKSDDKELVIPKVSLEAGVNYFTTVVTLDIIAPVDKTHLTNQKAEYKYSYGDKTYFFSSEANYNRFREHPEQFVTPVLSDENSDSQENP
ncbi:membrane protein [Yersinia enterocolitica]|nr:Fe-S-containing protein [Yersinia enterocolitica]AJJ28106.1 YHS domain protein [Yersinia enterocolitica]ALG78950.1 membrane protein [Yersinia enterocolitica]KGA59085.1 YHS domain protein [Yersinia enterocolitica]KGA65763.1 YHS domain protein [Yersinia enterocolitica]MDA5486288.1 Fe-S-containing protein [Yersinia enterocolitica]